MLTEASGQVPGMFRIRPRDVRQHQRCVQYPSRLTAWVPTANSGKNGQNALDSPRAISYSPGPMSRKKLLLLGFLLVAAPGRAADLGEPSSIALSSIADAQTGVLLLRNGQVIEGRIECLGDHYSVALPDQELQIRTGSVEFWCRDLHEGYRRKKQVVGANDVQGHIQLFQWCDHHGLLDCAALELAAAEAIDKEHPMIAVLKRRLKIETAQKNEPRPLPKAGPPLPSDEQLDQMIRGMPPGTVETFVQFVQPILLNHCPGAGGYPLPGNRNLQLMRPTSGESPSRRITQRNLHAILQYIDWDNPGQSPLLKATLSSAAIGNSATLPSQHSSQYQKLAQWVYQVAQKPMPADEMEPSPTVENASFAELASGGLKSAPMHITSARSMPRVLGNMNKAPAADAPRLDRTLDRDPKEGDARPIEPRTARGTTSRQPNDAAHAKRAALADASDPYDPAFFNQQSGGASAADATLPTPAARVIRGDGK